jgi:hypothetical protein
MLIAPYTCSNYSTGNGAIPMRLRAPEIEIPPESPFRNDLLGRKESAELLTELLRSTGTPLALCINAQWGEGKTTFLRMWLQLLRNADFRTLYFSAWENDFSDDALVSLIGELSAGIEGLSLNDTDARVVKKHLSKAKKIGAHFLRKGIPSAVKLATAGILDLDKVTEDVLAEFGEKLAKEQIENYEKSKKTIMQFRQELSMVAEKITSVNANKQRLPLVVIIDELDRCRPLFAIEVLEKAKHFFSVPNVVFVLAVDRTQLGYSIQSQYGARTDIDGYLKRFIDLDYNLPIPEKGAFCKAQFDRFGLREFFEGRKGSESQFEYGQFEEMFSDLFSILELTLREQERCFTLLSMAVRTTADNQLMFPLLLGTLIVLKVKKQELYAKFVNGSVGKTEILNEILAHAGGKEFLDNNYGIALEAHLVICRSRYYGTQDQALSYQNVVNDPKTSTAEKQRAQNIIEELNSFGSRNRSGILNYLVKKIDMVSQFK